jgi:iron complex outermembrane receptor protein
VIWARNAASSNIRDEYYRNKGVKDDFNSYLKISYSLFEQTTFFVDVQYRSINYKVEGTEQYIGPVKFDDQLTFINPKIGMNYNLNSKNQFYYSFAVANREPNRNDYFNADDFGAKPERLNDHELGYRYRFSSNVIQTNVYYMDYKDQLVLTGEINNVGEALRSNVGNSYRAGLELSAEVFLFKNLKWLPNVTFSKNTNVNYTFLDVSGNFVEGNTPLAYSPEAIINNALQTLIIFMISGLSSEGP